MASLAGTFSQSYLDENIGYRLTDTAIAFIVLDTVFCLLRAWARKFIKAPLGWDDALVSLGFLFGIGVSIGCLLVVKDGAAGLHLVHVVAVSPTILPYFLKMVFIAIPIMYALSSTFPKLAILVLYLKIFRAKWSRVGCYITAAVLILACICNIATIIWQCTPVDYLWNQYLVPSAKGHCFNARAHFLYGAIPNILTDVAMLLLPIETIWKLQTTQKMKISIYLTFLTGSIGLVASIIRFVVFFNPENDITWDAVPLLIWIIAEPGIYLIASCLIACRPLASWLIYDRVFSTISSQFSRLRSRQTPKTTGDIAGFSGIRTEPEIELHSNDGQSDRKILGANNPRSINSEDPDPEAV